MALIDVLDPLGSIREACGIVRRSDLARKLENMEVQDRGRAATVAMQHSRGQKLIDAMIELGYDPATGDKLTSQGEE